MRQFIKKRSSAIIAWLLIGMACYGAARLYFQVTGGFSISHIMDDLTHEPLHQVAQEAQDVQQILSQPFHYLGKGCQSYVFRSDDGKYVLKFLKYQRFRTPKYLDGFVFIDQVADYKKKKTLQKREKLDALLDSWKLAYNHLSKNTGLVYLHLNQTDIFHKPLYIIDKMGLHHEVPADDLVFLLQLHADMLCPALDQKMQEGKVSEAKQIISRLVDMLVAEYERGFGDNDHALMQNTAVVSLQPMHIDVGQFSQEERFKNPGDYKHEIFSKTYKFRIWLSKKYPELEEHLSHILENLIGPQMHEMKPKLKTIDAGL
jgi:hypothetical protein